MEWSVLHEHCDAPPITCDPRFAAALAQAFPDRFRARPLRIEYGDRYELAVAYEEQRHRGLRAVTLSPFGLPSAVGTAASEPRWKTSLDAVARALRIRYRAVGWTIPFWASPKAQSMGERDDQQRTHALALDRSWEDLFKQTFEGKTRQFIRRAEREGVEIRAARTTEDALQYYAMHRALADEKGGYDELLPFALFEQLLSVPSVEIQLACIGGVIAGGGVFLHDGPTVFYWHGALDRRFRLAQPIYALFEVMIRRAIARGRRWFHFGGSAGIRSLERFKEAWGAKPFMCSTSVVHNPAVLRIKQLFGSVVFKT